MQIRSRRFLIALFIILVCCAGAAADATSEKALPAFGRDTVLVWKIQNLDYSADFVVRIAQFLPDRYLEWEDELTQGTVFMPGQDIEDANGYINSNLFKSGSDTRGNQFHHSMAEPEDLSRSESEQKGKVPDQWNHGAFCVYRAMTRLRLK